MSERVLTFGGAARMVGILTEADRLERSDALPAVVLLNSGLIHRVAPNRRQDANIGPASTVKFQRGRMQFGTCFPLVVDQLAFLDVLVSLIRERVEEDAVAVGVTNRGVQ